MAATVWKGHLTFGLISIPLRLHSAARSERISFNQLHKECHARLKQPLFCPKCNRMVERTEIIKGYEHEKDQYVLFSEEEMDKVQPASARTMEILEFVRLEQVDPLHFDASYLATPEEAGQKAYYLLMEAMQQSGFAAIAKLCMHQREYTVVIRPRAKGLTLHTMYYVNEIRQVDEYGQTDKVDIKDAERKLAMQLIESLAADFDPQKYRDEYQTRLRGLLDAKLAGREVTETSQPQLAPVIDLMEALKKSLSDRQVPKKPPARMAPTVVPKTAARKSKKSG